MEFEAAGQLSGLDVNSVALRLSNEYARSDTSHASHQYPWKGGVVEPWRVTTLSLVNMTDGAAVAMTAMPDASDANLELHWEVHEVEYSTLNSTGEGGEPRGQPMATGVTDVAGQFEVTFKRAGLFHTVEAHLHGPSAGGSGVVTSFSHTIMCKYVRREVRALNDDDKERYLSALEVVHRTSMKDGAELYGSNFRNFEHFTTKHLWKMTLEKCTPWHGEFGPVSFRSRPSSVPPLTDRRLTLPPRAAAHCCSTTPAHRHQLHTAPRSQAATCS